MSKVRKVVKVKEENEIQSYINSFKEIEEMEEEPTTSAVASKIPELESEDYDQIIERDDADAGGDDDFKYVFIVQDEEDGNSEKPADAEGEVYEFDEFEEDALEEADDKSKIVKILSHTTIKKAGGQPTAPQGNNIHMCSYCNYTTPKRYLLARHMKCHSEDRPHKCNVCERGFKTIASLTNHVNTHTGTKPHLCKFCDSAFTTSGELVRHTRYRHTHEKPHKCPECDYASVELSKLKRHIRCHTGERPYQCPHCTYASPDTFKLKRHLRIHTGEKPYQFKLLKLCNSRNETYKRFFLIGDICQARFTQSNSLKAHKMIHSVGEKPVFQCELCPTTCGRKTDLRIHVQKLHTSEEPLKCKRCDSEFPDRYSYKLHTKTHEGEKCYRCELCAYASISARHLESHMLIHTDQKPFKCQFCDQSFRQKQLLKRHENIYHNPDYVAVTPREKTHRCPTCDKAFRHKGNLMRHIASHETDGGVHVKGEPVTEEMLEENYVVVEVIQDGTEEQYEDEGSDIVLEEEEDQLGEEIVEDGDYTLTENMETDVIMSLKTSPQNAGSSALSFGFSDDDDDEAKN